MSKSIKHIVVIFILGFLAADTSVSGQNPDSEVVVPSPKRPRGQVKAPVIRSDPERVASPTVPDTTPATGSLMEVVLPAGTGLEVRTTDELTSKTVLSGDTFEALLDRDFTVNGRTVIPKGSLLVGQVDEVRTGGRVKGRAQMILTLSHLELGDERYELETSPIEIEARSSKVKDAKTVGIAAGLGALIGAVAGGKKGAVIGATVGGGAGAGRVLTSKGKPAVVEAEQLLTFRLERETTVLVTP